MPSLFWGWFWVVIGVLLIIAGPILNWFQFSPFGFPLPVGALALMYGGIVVIYYRTRSTVIQLTPDDLVMYGGKLEQAVPTILDLLQKKVPVKDIVKKVEQKHKLPREITYKYIITLGRRIKSVEREQP
jgi:hypothetical protein